MLRHSLYSSQAPLKPVLLRSALPAAAVLLIAAILSVVAGHFRAQARSLRQAVDRFAVVEGRAPELRLQQASRQAKREQMEHLAAQLPGRTGDDAVRMLGQCLPNDVWLRSVEIVDLNALHVQGASFLEAGIYEFVRWLEAAPTFAEAALKGTTPGTSTSGPVTNFEVDVRLADLNAPPKSSAGEYAPAEGSVL